MPDKRTVGRSGSGDTSRWSGWQKARWITAGVLALVVSVYVVVGAYWGRLDVCGETPVDGLEEPVRECDPVNPVVLIPVAVLALLLILPDYRELNIGAFGFRRELEHQFEEQNRFLEEITGVRKFLHQGIIKKGRIRNVELRVESVQQLLAGVVAHVDKNEQGPVLESVGRAVGASWGQNLEGLDLDRDDDRPDLEKRLDQWSYYDATAGLGHFEFEADYETNTVVRVTVRNGFLDRSVDGIDLMPVMVGYFAGTLEQLLDVPPGREFNTSLRRLGGGRTEINFVRLDED